MCPSSIVKDCPQQDFFNALIEIEIASPSLDYLLVVEVPRGSKSSKSSSELFEGSVELWAGVELYLSE